MYLSRIQAWCCERSLQATVRNLLQICFETSQQQNERRETYLLPFETVTESSSYLVLPNLIESQLDPPLLTFHLEFTF